MRKNRSTKPVIEPETLEIEDDKGNRVTVTRAHWVRWPQLAQHFRPVSENKATPPVAVTEAPTGDNEMEH